MQQLEPMEQGIKEEDLLLYGSDRRKVEVLYFTPISIRPSTKRRFLKYKDQMSGATWDTLLNELLNEIEFKNETE